MYKWQNSNNKNEFENIEIYTPRLTGSQLELNDVIFFFFFSVSRSVRGLYEWQQASAGPFRVWPTRANWPTMTLCPPAKVSHQQQENHGDSNVAPDIFFCFGVEHTHTHIQKQTHKDRADWFINSMDKIEWNAVCCCRYSFISSDSQMCQVEAVN